jgi:hypothetical protein
MPPRFAWSLRSFHPMFLLGAAPAVSVDLAVGVVATAIQVRARAVMEISVTAVAPRSLVPAEIPIRPPTQARDPTVTAVQLTTAPHRVARHTVGPSITPVVMDATQVAPAMVLVTVRQSQQAQLSAQRWQPLPWLHTRHTHLTQSTRHTILTLLVFTTIRHSNE